MRRKRSSLKAIGGGVQGQKIKSILYKIIFDAVLTPQTASQNNRRFPRYGLSKIRGLEVYIGIYIGENAPKMDLNCFNVVISNQIHSKQFLIQ